MPTNDHNGIQFERIQRISNKHQVEFWAKVVIEHINIIFLLVVERGATSSKAA